MSDNSKIPRYTFKSKLIAGVTPIVCGNPYDYFIHRINGMKGFTLHLTVKGRGVIINGNERYTCSPGDMILFPPGFIHCYGRDETSIEWSHYWICFHPRTYWHDLLKWPNIIGGAGYFRTEKKSFRLFLDLFKEIIKISKTPENHQQLLAINLLEEILLRRISYLSNDSAKPLGEKISAACKYINENISDSSFSVEKVANYTNLSRYRLLHLFREELGVTILQWRDEQRMIVAKNLLSTTKLKISEIAYRVGVEDQLYFSRLFKRYVGITPSKYRQEMQTK